MTDCMETDRISSPGAGAADPQQQQGQQQQQGPQEQQQEQQQEEVHPCNCALIKI